MRNILALGHSHIGAIRLAAIQRREAGVGKGRVRTIHVQDPTFGDPTGEGFTVAHMPPLLREALRDQIGRHRPQLISVLNGNMHSVIAMVREDPPFDFKLSGEPSPPHAADATIISEGEVRSRLESLMQVDLGRLTRLREEFGRFRQLESPPPVAARSFIERRLESFFIEQPQYRSNGLSPAGLRYRMWRLSCRITEEHCRTLGCDYSPTPRQVLDSSGFLAQAFAADSTHGNLDYGEQWIMELERLMREERLRRFLPSWLHRLAR